MSSPKQLGDEVACNIVLKRASMENLPAKTNRISKIKISREGELSLAIGGKKARSTTSHSLNIIRHR